MATDRIQIVPLKNALKTQLEILTWTPSGNASPTSFVGGVYGTVKLADLKDSPWCFIVDESPEVIKKAMGGLLYERRTPIAIYICSNYGSIGEQEAEDRIIYAYEAVETLLTTKATMDAISAPGYRYMGFESGQLDETKVKYRKLILQIQSRI